MKQLTSKIATTPTYDENDYKATEAYTMYTGILLSGETKSHEVRIWLHESAGNETQNKNFYSKVVIEGIQNNLASIRLNEYIMNKNDASIEEITHEATEQTPALTDYRYTGSDPNNYVYFGCEGKECTEENLYRIIGVIPTQSSETSSYKNRVKLIKATNWEGETAESGSQYTASGKGYFWNTGGTNKWESSTLQQTLNGEYWNSLEEYQKFIEQAKWYLGAPEFNVADMETRTVKYYYNTERSHTSSYNQGLLFYMNNIGLMYPSDYGYSIEKNFWNQNIGENISSYENNSWLSSQKVEWTITPEKSHYSPTLGTIAWYVGSTISASHISHTNIYGVRPTFYLSEDVLYVGGSGTKGDPYRIGKEEKKFSDYIIAERQNDSSIEQVVHEETEQTGLNASVDYRYTGANPNNYVCFGSETTPCPSDNLYRIIGVIPTQSTEDGSYENRVKLIKSNYYTETSSGLLLKQAASTTTPAPTSYGYNWNSSANNKWEESTLQKQVLNGIYWNSLKSYQSFIATAKWYLGAPIYTSSKWADLYNIERSDSQCYSQGKLFFVGNVGLMYPSDYFYSFNWLKTNLEENYREWTITPEKTYTSVGGYAIYPGGIAVHSIYNEARIFGIRPTFYLKADVLYSKGDGSSSNPYYISL